MNVSLDRGKVAVVHSSWLAGTQVQCAGSMLIEDGIVKGIRNNSGHYFPTDSHMVNVLELLRTVGVDIGDVEVFDYKGRKVSEGNEFLAAQGNWDAIYKRKGLSKEEPKKAQAPPTRGAKPKKKYRCVSCGRIYEESYPVTFCYCKGACRPV